MTSCRDEATSKLRHGHIPWLAGIRVGSSQGEVETKVNRDMKSRLGRRAQKGTVHFRDVKIASKTWDLRPFNKVDRHERRLWRAELPRVAHRGQRQAR